MCPFGFPYATTLATRVSNKIETPLQLYIQIGLPWPVEKRKVQTVKYKDIKSDKQGRL